MRRMRVSPEHRQSVYNAVRSHWKNEGVGISSDTLANRTRLDVLIVEACCEAMVESRALENVGIRSDHPMWRPAVIR